MSQSTSDPSALNKALWNSTGETVAAHVVMLSDVGLIDEDAAATLLGAVDGVSGGEPPDATLAGLVALFDDRLDAQTPAGVSGTARVGRAVADTVATVVRLFMRERVLELGESLDRTRRAALDLAVAHVTTLMPAYVGGQPAQPTNFGHFLGGLIGPLGRSATRLPGVYAEVNRSPLGAGLLASTGMAIERERTAELLGFDGLVVNTFDAVSAADHVAAVGETANGIAMAVGRFLAEVRSQLRTEPGSFRLADAWTEPVPDLPHLRVPARLERLVASVREVQSNLTRLADAEADLPYGPIAWNVDPFVTQIDRLLGQTNAVLAETAELLAGGIEVNRAYLANRAGRSHTTTSDLADFLMIEEQLDPGTAQSIAARTTARIVADGIESSGITPEIIDVTALMVLGREVKVEFEAISRYLAPRRYLERRTATGAPSPNATRAYLDQELLRLGTDERWRTGMRARIVSARSGLNRAMDQAHAQR